MAIFLLNKGIAEVIFKKMCASLYKYEGDYE